MLLIYFIYISQYKYIANKHISSSTILDQLNEMKDTQTDIENDMCIICFDNEKSITFACGHTNICVLCTKKLMKNENPLCPFCGEEITNILK